MYGAKREHKNILEMIDSIHIVATTVSTLLMLNWEKYKVFEASAKANPDSGLDVPMLNALMQVRGEGGKEPGAWEGYLLSWRYNRTFAVNPPQHF